MELSNAALASLTSGVAFSVPGICTLPGYGVVGLTVIKAERHYTVPLQRVVFNCRWVSRTIDGQQLLVPSLRSNGGGTLLRVEWQPPSDCQMLVLVSFSVREHRPSKYYLFAQKKSDNTLWRIPAANLHENCEWCTGDPLHFIDGPTDIDALVADLNRVQEAPWNSDLCQNQALIESFLRVKAVSAGFETVPPASEWHTLCQKVGTTQGGFICR